MKKSLYVALLVVFAISSCKKEQISYTTIPEDPDPIDTPITPERMARHEILSAVYSGSDFKLPGKLLVHNYNNDLVKQIETPYAVGNLRRWDINDKYYYTYLQYDPGAYRIAGVGYIPGHYIITDEDFNEIKKIDLLPTRGRTSTDPSALDLHEFILLDENHYIVLAYYEQAVTNVPASLNPASNVKVVNCIIQEVRNGQITFEWHSVDFPEFYTTSVQNNDFSDTTKTLDYLHINGIFVDPADDHLIVSARNTDQVFKVNRNTGNIMWRLGGNNSDFPLTDQQKFYRQHNATITSDGKTLLLFDNGVAGVREYSRILEFNLDYLGRTVNSFKATHVPYNLFCEFMGSVQKTDSSYFIGCGTSSRIIEVDYTTLDVIRDIRLERSSYRSYVY